MTELEFAARLKQYRKNKGLTQQELADILGVSNKSISRWESGSYPDVTMLGPLAHALGVTVDDLLGEAKPIRTMDKSDWQNLLSFAFAIGGGVLYFLLVLFTPTIVAYLLYLSAMAYGVYLQKHFTYHSKWFHRGNLVMNFFVNYSMVRGMIGIFTAAWVAIPNLITLLADIVITSSGIGHTMIDGYAMRFILVYLLFLLTTVGLTALTAYFIRKYNGGEKIAFIKLPAFTFDRTAMSRRKWIPVGQMLLVALFWSMYLITGKAPLPAFLYTNQTDWYLVLLGLFAAICVTVFIRKGHRAGLIPALLLTASCTILTRFSTWDYVYNGRDHLVYRHTLPTHVEYAFGRPTHELYIALAAFTVIYLLLCCVRPKHQEKEGSDPSES